MVNFSLIISTDTTSSSRVHNIILWDKYTKNWNISDHYFFSFFSFFSTEWNRRYCFILYVVVSASPFSGRLPFYRFPVRSSLYTATSVLYTTKSRATLVSTCGTARDARLRGGRGVPWWRGGVLSLVRVFNRACSLTARPIPDSGSQSGSNKSDEK